MSLLPVFKIVNGGTNNYEDGECCIMQAAVARRRVMDGNPMGEPTDEMYECSPIINQFMIEFNDSVMWDDDTHRTDTLFPFVDRLAGTKDQQKESTRTEMLRQWAALEFGVEIADDDCVSGDAVSSAERVYLLSGPEGQRDAVAKCVQILERMLSV